ncbi:MAG: chorismate mutase [Chloroflexi bacterium]|nr:chorismate mutase [Chloroflexota bacterium]
MMVRGIRGATSVRANTREAIIDAATELLQAVVDANEIEHSHVASVFFTTTPDLDAEFPAVAAREAGWTNVPLLCGHEMAVPGALPRCMRLLMHVNTDRPPEEIRHVYLHEAAALRPDLSSHGDGGCDGR